MVKLPAVVDILAVGIELADTAVQSLRVGYSEVTPVAWNTPGAVRQRPCALILVIVVTVGIVDALGS